MGGKVVAREAGRRVFSVRYTRASRTRRPLHTASRNSNGAKGGVVAYGGQGRRTGRCAVQGRRCITQKRRRSKGPQIRRTQRGARACRGMTCTTLALALCIEHPRCAARTAYMRGTSGARPVGYCGAIGTAWSLWGGGRECAGDGRRAGGLRRRPLEGEEEDARRSGE